MSLTARVTLGALVVVALALGGGGAVILALADRQDRAAFDTGLRNELRSYGPPVHGTFEIGDGPRRALRDAFGRPDGTRFLRATSADGRHLALGSVPAGFPALREGAPRSVRGWREVTESDPQVTFALAVREDPLDDRASELRRIVLLTVLAGLVLAGVAAVVATRVALAPLTVLRRKATVADDHRVRVSAPGQPPEVAALAAEIDGLLARVGAALDAARRFAADAGHELRTPLQSIRSNLEIGDPQAVSAALGESARMGRLVDALQSLARGEAGLSATAPVDLGEIADGAVFAARGRHRDTVFTLDAPAHGPVLEGDGDGLWRVVENLLENAALHGGPTVRVSVTADPVRLVVEDDGPGVPASERERLLGRFQRGRDVRAPGSGLGLAIIAAEAERHGGMLALGRSPLGGLRATVVL